MENIYSEKGFFDLCFNRILWFSITLILCTTHWSQRNELYDDKSIFLKIWHCLYYVTGYVTCLYELQKNNTRFRKRKTFKYNHHHHHRSTHPFRIFALSKILFFSNHSFFFQCSHCKKILLCLQQCLCAWMNENDDGSVLYTLKFNKRKKRTVWKKGSPDCDVNLPVGIASIFHCERRFLPFK